MKSLFTTLSLIVLTCYLAFGQCPEQPTFTSNGNHGLCQDAFNMVPYIQSCQTVCMSNVNAGSSNQINDASCLGGSTNNDLFLVAQNPFASLSGYDGSLAFRWVDWPNKDNGALPPYITVHSEVEASFLGVTAQSIDCTDGFAAENAFCVDPNDTGAQFYALANTLPTTQQLDPIVDQQAGLDVDVNDVAYFLHFTTTDGATGDICFEVSGYQPGFVCGDALDVSLNGNSSQVTGSASGCLCETALYGGLSNPKINLPTACGTESESSAWYKVDLPFGCNSVDIDMNAWGGNDDYNIALVSNVDCPGTNDVNPITGAPISIPGDEPAVPINIEASSCGTSLSTACNPLPAGEYYIVISGASERPTFTFDVTVNEASPTAGTAASTFNNQDVCSEATIQVSTSGFSLPASAACGQDIAWFYGTSSTFNPYAGEGTYAGSGTTDVDVNLPANTSCSAQTYFVKGVVSDNGTTASSGCPNATNSIIVNVFPEIGLPTIVNDPCIIQVAGRCPDFTVNGNLGSDTYLASFADDGSTQSFVISNGLAACNETFTETVSCSGSCTQPTATTSLVCNPNDPFNFYVEIDFTPGSANAYTIVGTDGSALNISGVGIYTAGPFTNDNSVTLSIENTEDAACNLPLGDFVDNCNPQACPNLTSALAPTAGDVCVGDEVLLQASVDQGTLNSDFIAQWYLNGMAITNANTLNYLHTFDTDQGCSSEFQVFTIEIECLNPDAAPSTNTSMSLSSGGFNVYPIPQLGIDFYPDPNNCIVAPVDVCGGLSISYSPTTDLNPGDPAASIAYSVSVPGAPAGCEATGSYVVQCPGTNCNNDLNDVVATDPVVCFGEDYNLQLISSSTSMLSDGYALGYAVTTVNPFNDLEGAVNTAVNNGNIIGPFIESETVTLTNGVEYGNDTYYFIPFPSLDIPAGTTLWSTSGSFSVSAPFNDGSATFTIPELPYCNGVTEYDMNIIIDQTDNEGNLSAIDGMNSPIWNGPGGSTNFYSSNVTFTGNPSGTTHTITASGNLIWGSNINYTVVATYSANNTFPTLCPSCIDVSSAHVYELLPEIVLTPAPNPIVCENELLDLNDVNPSSNINGAYNWYDDDPSAGGNLLSNTEVVMLAGNNTYWVEFSANADASCTQAISISIPTTAPPTLNTPMTPDPICSGEIVDLPLMNNDISGGQAGNITWYRGNPSIDPFAVQLTDASAASQTPTDGTLYTAVFTDAGTGCQNQVSITYSVLDLPVLTPPVVNPSVCIGESFDLSTSESSLTSDSGTFDWYQGNPASGGTLLSNTNVSPTSSTEYCAVFTDGNGCQNTVCLTLDINQLPVLNTLPPQGPLCEGETFDLATINALYTNEAGTFNWYEGNPQAGGTLISNTEIIPNPVIIYYVEFTATLTGCSQQAFTTFLIEETPVLATPPNSTICEGESVNLMALENDITTDSGSFEWYEGNPEMGGLPVADPSNVTPTMDTDYYVVFTTSIGCSNMTFTSVVVNANPVLNTVSGPGLCMGSSVDLASSNVMFTTENGTFTWSESGNILNNTIVTPSSNTTYDVQFVNDNGCEANASMEVIVYSELDGGIAFYDCLADSLVVDLSGVTGGTGTGYMVSVFSNQPGETLANGTNWTVIIEDDNGCLHEEISGVVDCIVCDAGMANTNDNTTICCGDTIQVTISDETLAAGNIIGYALTTSSDGPVEEETDLDNAIQLIPGDENNALLYISNCNLDAGDYYLTPFVAQESMGAITELEYDTLNGCIPNGEFCPIIGGSDWVLDPLILHFPDGTFLNINDDQAFGLPITPELLQAVGGNIPCLQLTDLYSGDPNGVWWFEINNVGTGDLEFSNPAFQVIVEAATCAALNGVDQVVTIDSLSGIVAGGTSDSIGFMIPAPVEVPQLVYDTLNGCTPMGAFCPEISGTDWILDPLVFIFPDGTEYNVNDEQAFGLAITPDLLAAVGGIGCIEITDLYSGDPNGTWTIQANNTGTGDVTFDVPEFDVVVDASTCTQLNGTDQVFTVPAQMGTIPGATESSLSFDIMGPMPSTFPTINPACEAYGDPILFTILEENDPQCTPVSNNDIESVSTFNIYPNPTDGRITMEIGLEEANDIQIQVTDVLGRLVMDKHITLVNGIHLEPIDLGNHPNGLFIVNVYIGNQVISKKVVKN